MKLTEAFQPVFEAVVIGSTGNKALKDSDTIRVYHGTNDLNLAIVALTKGISGGSRIYRTYSYENNNNPKGLFVTPDLKTAKEFGAFIFEFHTRVRDLEAPVWPGGMFTVQGGMSGIFNSNDEREQERMRQRMKWSQSEYDYVKNSDRPELAATLLAFGERQALFTGDLNPNSIRAIWVRQQPNRVSSPFDRFDPKTFLKNVREGKVSSLYGGVQSKADENSEYVKKAAKKVLTPRDDVSGQEFIRILTGIGGIYTHMERSELIRILSENPDYIQRLVWNDRQLDRIMKDLKRLT